MLLNPDLHSYFILIDVQEKLTPLVQNSALLLKRCERILMLAQHLQYPILISEQYPKGLGKTVKQLTENLSTAVFFEKIYFSAAKDNNINAYLQKESPKQLILFGIEAHVCVLQSAIDWQEQGYQVFVIEDAISARHTADLTCAIRRLSQSSIQLISAEMLFFELLQKAGTEKFKQLSPLFLHD